MRSAKSVPQPWGFAQELSPTNRVVAAALAYTQRGWRVVPIPVGRKMPVMKGWQNLRLRAEEIPSHFSDPTNIGVLLGEPSGWLVDVDLDHPLAAALAETFLPPTGAVFGRRGKPSSHRLYVCPGAKTTRWAARRDGRTAEMLVELRSTGAQTVFPPSQHPSGEIITWERDGEPATVDSAELTKGCAALAAATLLAASWPGQGGRQEAALALAGGLLRAGWRDEEAARFIAAVARAASDEETAKRAEAAEYTARRLSENAPTTGWTRLAELVGWDVVRKVREWLQAGVGLEAEPAPPPMLPESVKPFPLEALPGGVLDFVREAAQAEGCPPEFIAVPALTILGAAIGSRYVLEVKRDWRFPANLYTCVVAHPGSGKSPAKDLAARPLYELQKELAKDYERAMEIYQQELAMWEARVIEARRNGEPRPRKPEEPRMAEVFTTDTTVEALAETLAHNQHGILLLLDELSGWVTGLNQYKGGRGSDREAYLSFWNGATAKVNRKGKPPVVLERPFVAVTGCLVPSALKILTAEYGEDGFLHRILFAFPDFVASPWPEGMISARAWEAYRKLFRRLWELPAAPGNPVVLELTPEAYGLWVEMFNQVVEERSRPDFPDYLHGPWAKLPSQAARLALIIHLCDLMADRLDSEGAPQLGPVDEFAMAKGWLLVDYFKSHARRVYAELRESPEDKLIRRILEWARRRKKTRFALRELVMVHLCDSVAQARQAGQRLEEKGAGRLVNVRSTTGRGRSSEIFVLSPNATRNENSSGQ